MTARLPLKDALGQKRKRRKDDADLFEQAEEEGWRYLNADLESLVMLPASNLASTFRFTMRGNRWLTRMTVFRTAITDTLIQRVLN
jgi:hypothetical protein